VRGATGAAVTVSAAHTASAAVAAGVNATYESEITVQCCSTPFHDEFRPRQPGGVDGREATPSALSKRSRRRVSWAISGVMLLFASYRACCSWITINIVYQSAQGVLQRLLRGLSLYRFSLLQCTMAM